MGRATRFEGDHSRAVNVPDGRKNARTGRSSEAALLLNGILLESEVLVLGRLHLLRLFLRGKVRSAQPSMDSSQLALQERPWIEPDMMESGHSLAHADERTARSGQCGLKPSGDAGPARAPHGHRGDEPDPDAEGAKEVDGDGAQGGLTEDQGLEEDGGESNERRLTIEKLAALAAVGGSLTLVLSVIYDWGFLSALGISMADAPTSLADHLGSWLEWAPRYVILMTFVVLYRLSAVRTVLGLIPSSVYDSLPTRPRWTKSKRRRRAAELVAGAAFILWLLIGGSPALVVIPGIIYGMILVDWITDHPLLTPPRGVLFLVRLAPVLVLLFFTFGYWSLDRAVGRTMPKAYVQIHSANTSGSALAERYVVRSFANWLLVQGPDRTQVDWVRMEQVDRIEVHPNVRLPGLLCGVFDLWCRSHTLTPDRPERPGQDVGVSSTSGVGVKR